MFDEIIGVGSHFAVIRCNKIFVKIDFETNKYDNNARTVFAMGPGV